MRPLLDCCCSRHVARKHILRLRLRLERVSQQREQELAIEHVEQYGVDTQLLESCVLQRNLLINQRKRIQSFAWRQGTREKVPGRSQAFLAVVTSPPIRVSQLAPATMGLWQRMIPSSSATCAGCFGASCFGARRMSEFASGRTSAAHLWQAVATSANQHQWII